MPDKKLIKFRFKKSIDTYDTSAVIQKEMAHQLIDKVLEYCGNSFDRVFEFGVGTGFLSKSILDKIEFKEYYANDIIEESEFCIKNIIKDVKFLAGDIERIELVIHLPHDFPAGFDHALVEVAKRCLVARHVKIAHDIRVERDPAPNA